jgi:hypothetical protein
LGCSPAARDEQPDGPGDAVDPSDSLAAVCRHATETTSYAGPDGALGTGDDIVTEVSDIVFEPGQPDVLYHSRPVAVTTKAPDGHVMVFNKWTYDTAGVRRSVTQYGPGPDGIYDTADDTTIAENLYTSDAGGLLVNDLVRSDAGPDGVWGNADDTIGAAIRFVHAQGHVAWALPSEAPGPDGDWATADDLFESSEQVLYDDQGRASTLVGHSAPGPDGMFGTDDDVINVRVVLPCRGDRVVKEMYSSPGPDGQWGTLDDVLSGRVVESGDLCESATCEPVLY